MSSPYDPADDAINTVLSGLLPALIFGMFRGFESEKKKKISFINIFDDLIIFGSIVAFPMCTGFELYQYFNVKPNIYGILATLITAILGIFSYLLFLFPRRQINNLNIKILDRLCNPISSTYFFIVSLVLSLYFGYFNLSLITTDYCIINIGFSKCKTLKIMVSIILLYSIIVLLFHLSSHRVMNRKNTKVLLRVLQVLKWLHMISLTVYPAIVSGYLLSDNPRTTKIAFGITSISFTRLANHFGDKPEEINTAISTYLNFKYNNESQIKIKKRTDETKVQTELTGNEVTEELKNEIEAEEEERIEIKIKNLTKELTEKIPKLRNTKINEIENLIKELADTCKQNVEIEISEQPDPTKVLSNLKNEIIEIEILKDEITGQLENMKKLREEIIKEQLTKKD
ncbi:uncharacterized protein OCT59_008437 [Rhizophagus irregularis]|uniref:uncharacterized protein n=1 Tax=Rhizophagus irregularis TaxID=588596 RepID=UPI0033250864|nr:hypothetical protein OCT59_008437 [Rhizophagus irregularis]